MDKDIEELAKECVEDRCFVCTSEEAESVIRWLIEKKQFIQAPKNELEVEPLAIFLQSRTKSGIPFDELREVTKQGYIKKAQAIVNRFGSSVKNELQPEEIQEIIAKHHKEWYVHVQEQNKTGSMHVLFHVSRWCGDCVRELSAKFGSSGKRPLNYDEVMKFFNTLPGHYNDEKIIKAICKEFSTAEVSLEIIENVLSEFDVFCAAYDEDEKHRKRLAKAIKAELEGK